MTYTVGIYIGRAPTRSNREQRRPVISIPRLTRPYHLHPHAHFPCSHLHRPHHKPPFSLHLPLRHISPQSNLLQRHPPLPPLHPRKHIQQPRRNNRQPRHHI